MFKNPNIQNIINSNSHRPWKIPVGKWEYYQEWNNALFLHWSFPYEAIRELVPKELQLDSFEGKYYISLVAFTMQKIYPKNLFPLKFISDFHEINIRTYVDNNDKKGVYFLNIEAEKALSSFIARELSGLPYEKSEIHRSVDTYTSINSNKNFSLDIEYKTGNLLTHKSKLDLWLTERYCLYLDKKNHIYRYEIHHKEWDIRQVEFSRLDINYKLTSSIDLKKKTPDAFHFSEGVKVISWKKEKLF